ncbi:hypothetical protein P879_05499 [Paragonimus westermani]|uniref:Uncharacterized protein n=1 Tax=Paragonimus westermani TaxID=34504 RepID=A0A8T0CY66_9TREM|nr:hypothetical protein P879_05499 [Paragonimus westermani]
MLKSNTGVFDGVPMLSKAGRGSPGRNSHGHGSQPNLHSGGTSPLVTGPQTGAQPVSVSVGPPRGGTRFHAMDAHLATSRVSNANSLHRSSPQHTPPQYLPRYGNNLTNTTLNHSPHLQSIQSAYQYHVHHHNHHTPSYPVHSTAQNMYTGPVSVVRTQTPGLQLRDFMLNQWNQFRCQHTSTDIRFRTLASTPLPSTSPVKVVNPATPLSSPSSTPVPPQPGSSSPLSAGGSTDHYCSGSLPRRYTQHHTDCSWPADNGSTGGTGYRRRGGAVAHFTRQSSSGE